MKRKDLEKLELEGDVIDEILKLHGLSTEKKKADLETAQSEIDTLKQQLSDANDQIAGMKDLKTPEEYQKAVDEWKGKAETAQREAKEQVEQLKFSHALDAALSAEQAKNLKAVRALLNADDLKLSESGELVGFSEQIKQIKDENAYLFEGDEASPSFTTKTNSKKVYGDSVLMAARKAAGLGGEE